MFSKVSIKYKLLLPVIFLGFAACFSLIWTLLRLRNLATEATLVEVSDIATFLQLEFSKILIISLFFITAVSVFFIILSYRYGKQMLRNIIQIKHAMDEVAAGNFDQKVKSLGDDEFRALAHKINEVITNLMVSNAALTLKTEEYEKTFKQLVDKNKTLEEMKAQTEEIMEDLRKKTANLEQENIKNEAILTNIGDGLIITDKDRKVTLVNTAAERMLGWEANELIGICWPEERFAVTDDFMHEVPADMLPIVRALKERQTQKTTLSNALYYVRKNGSRFPVAITASPIIVNDDVVGVIVVFRDITNDKEVDKAKTEFVSLASHQLRTPLTSINWYTEMILAGDAGKTTDKQLKYLSEIYRGSQRMVNLVNSLLNASRIELGTLKILPEKIDLRHVVDSVLNELAPLIEEKKLQITKQYGEIPVIDLDPNLIRVVFQNVMSNAVIYSPENGSITLGLEAKEDHVLAIVKDTGYGIPLDQQDMIFTKLFRADNVQQLDTNGSGLGLYISQSIIEHAHGKIWFESEPQKGSSFYIMVPYQGMKERDGSRSLS